MALDTFSFSKGLITFINFVNAHRIFVNFSQARKRKFFIISHGWHSIILVYKNICDLTSSSLLILSKFYDLPAGASSVSSAKRLSTYWSASSAKRLSTYWSASSAKRLSTYWSARTYMSSLRDFSGTYNPWHPWYPCE